METYCYHHVILTRPCFVDEAKAGETCQFCDNPAYYRVYPGEVPK